MQSCKCEGGIIAPGSSCHSGNIIRYSSNFVPLSNEHLLSIYSAPAACLGVGDAVIASILVREDAFSSNYLFSLFLLFHSIASF